ncbi:MAG: transcriptional repressor LexA [Spirochaetales bacterium]|nr:transcriptional repressor LexA [Spirochaetales bacterium]
MKGLTKRQKEVLEFICDFIKTHRYPPTIREIAQNFQISVKGGYDHLKALQKKRYIRYDFKRSRTIEILKYEDQKNPEMTKIPILGNVAAGKPLFAEENFDGEVEFPEYYIGKGKHFALHVKGDSMKDAGILDGDIAIIQHQNVAENGEIVVAMLNEAVTLKRFCIEKNRIRLQSENKAYPPIFAMDVRILGKLACLIRRYD